MIGLIDGDVLLHASLWNTLSKQEAIDNVNMYLDYWIDSVVASNILIALGPDSGNQRDDLFPDYKQTTLRVKGRDHRPDYFKDVKNYIAELGETCRGVDIEADDLLGHWSNQLGETSAVS